MNNKHDMIDYLLGNLSPEAAEKLKSQCENDAVVASELERLNHAMIESLEGDGEVAALVEAAVHEGEGLAETDAAE